MVLSNPVSSMLVQIYFILCVNTTDELYMYENMPFPVIYYKGTYF